MPIKQAGKKALRQAKKRAAANLIVKNAYKDAVKAARKAVVSQSKEAVEKAHLAQKMLDKAVKKGVLKKGAASRKLSRLMKKVNVLPEK